MVALAGGSRTNFNGLDWYSGVWEERKETQQARWALFFPSVNFIMCYHPGPKNVKQDFLSHLPSPESEPKPLAPILPPTCFVEAITWEAKEMVEALLIMCFKCMDFLGTFFLSGGSSLWHCSGRCSLSWMIMLFRFSIILFSVVYFSQVCVCTVRSV